MRQKLPPGFWKVITSFASFHNKFSSLKHTRVHTRTHTHTHSTKRESMLPHPRSLALIPKQFGQNPLKILTRAETKLPSSA